MHRQLKNGPVFEIISINIACGKIIQMEICELNHSILRSNNEGTKYLSGWEGGLGMTMT